MLSREYIFFWLGGGVEEEEEAQPRQGKHKVTTVSHAFPGFPKLLEVRLGPISYEHPKAQHEK